MSTTDLRERLEDIGTVRLSDVVSFFRETGRSDQCPFCSYKGSWDFHIQWPDGEDTKPEEDPAVCVYDLKMTHNGDTHPCTAVTCPKCGHFSMIDLYMIKLKIAERRSLAEKLNG